MTKKDILRDSKFSEVAEVRADSKRRIALGKSVTVKAAFYKVYQNSMGQIILDPQVTIPAHEAWLFQNQEAASMVNEGLKQAKQGKIVKAREDYSKFVDESD